MVLNRNCQLVIFDLDGTLHTFKDAEDQNAKISNDILNILFFFKQNNIKIALASLNESAEKYLIKYNIMQFFDFVQCKNWMIDGNYKIDLFNKIYGSCDIPFENMLYFDDRLSHCTEAMDLGIKTVIVDQFKLITWRDVFLGLDYFNYDIVKDISTQTKSKHSFKNTVYKKLN